MPDQTDKLMPDLTDGEFAELMDFVSAEADNREKNAGYAGESHDGGASELRAGVELFRAGMNRSIPIAWLPFVRQMRIEEDPEYQEYLRLHEKFGGEVF